MQHIARRRLVAPLVAFLAIGVGVVVAPPAAEAAVTGTIKVSGTLNVRAGATTSSKAVGKLRNGARISIACQVIGQSVKGNVRRTTAWNRLTNGRYVSHAYVVSAAVPPCPVAGTIKVSGSVNVRVSSTTVARTVGALGNKAKVSIVCQIPGQYVRGDVRATAAWDRLTNGRYVSHAYVLSGAIPRCTTPAPKVTSPPVAPPAPAMTNAEFIAASVAGAQRGWREHQVPASVTIAQAILESGWGRSKLSANDRNYFGIKCFNNDPGRYAIGCRSYQTQECDKAGKCFTTSATFRVYASMADSYRDHGYFLRSNSRYAASFAYNRNPNKFIDMVWKAGYATDPAYYTKITGIMKTYNLYQYDIWR
ncbi:flagellar protein FlgJ [Micromonospora pattaloongensis]|uniref:Flagellar protein FlgJ n=1 Tax=Micromonospora pattaloongensis TaxID=405436 RepID=A0A1H3MYX4_9ACTN|nr:sporangiospore maturation cell wall hydrolase GsmA [Micromonospora pattaloongensis]SDY81897.1 flagellar protein FlgJ [Micromonospora pattaloongensis]